MEVPPDQFFSVIEHYKLTEEDSNQPITDCHLEEISRSYCSRWKSLAPYLQSKSITVEDIDRDHRREEDKRYAFFFGWKRKKGSDATYKTLITALLKIDCKDDAEGMCKLLASTQQPCSNASLKIDPSTCSPIQVDTTVMDDTSAPSTSSRVLTLTSPCLTPL